MNNLTRQRSVVGLSKSIQLNNEPLKSTGSVAKLAFGKQLKTFKVAFANASSAAQNYILGDPHGIIANELSGTYNSPTSASTLVDGMKASFSSSPVEISGIQYKVTASAAQFSNDISYVTSDLNGKLDVTPIHVSAAERNTANNDKILTLDLTGHQIILGALSALTTAVDGNETVNWTLMVGAAAR